MSDYRDGEALLQTLLATVSGFTSQTVTRGKWGVLNSGKADKYTVLKPGASGRRHFEGHNQITEPWVTLVYVYQRYKDDGTSLERLEETVALILSMIDQHPHLQNGDHAYVVDSNAVTVGEVSEVWTRGGGPAWIRQIVTVEWTGQKIVTFS